MKNDEYQFKDGTSVRSTYERVLNLEPPPFSSDFRPTLLARSTMDRVLRALVSSLSFSLLARATVHAFSCFLLSAKKSCRPAYYDCYKR